MTILNSSTGRLDLKLLMANVVEGIAFDCIKIILSLELGNDCLRRIEEVIAETHIILRDQIPREGTIQKAARIVEGVVEDITLEKEVIQGVIRMVKVDHIVRTAITTRNTTIITIIRNTIDTISMINMIKKRDLNQEVDHPAEDEEAKNNKAAIQSNAWESSIYY